MSVVVTSVSVHNIDARWRPLKGEINEQATTT
jgi:hypothetical protein